MWYSSFVNKEHVLFISKGVVKLKDKRIKYLEYLPIIVLAILAYRIFNSYDVVLKYFNQALAIFVPFFWAFAFAYMINPLMKLISNRFKLGRGLSILISYCIVIGVFALIVTFVAPGLSESVADIVTQIPEYTKTITDFAEVYGEKYQVFDFLQLTDSLSTDNISSLENAMKSIAEFSSGLISSMLIGVVGFTTGLFKVLIGLIISIYFLKDKERFKTGIKKIIFSVFKKDTALALMEVGNEANELFVKYFIGKAIDSLIIGVICYIGLLVLQAPYAILLAFIIALTNMIPFFGPFIGGVPAVLITLFHSPLTALWVGIFIIVLQQLDGYVIGPKILGDSVGIGPFWIILAILVGGATFGILGMLVGVPVVALLRMYAMRFFDKRIKEKDLEKYI